MKILFLDSWTKGIHNFSSVACELRSMGVNSMLIHWGSWGNEPDRPDEEIIDDLLCRDIRYYGTNLLHKVLTHEMPNVVVVLTTNTLANRAVILAARSLRVTSCFLMHGVVFVGDKREADTPGMEENHRAMRWKRASKYLRYVLPNYFYSGIKHSPLFLLSTSPYRLVWNSFSSPAQYYWSPPPSPELQCDRALVWAEVYREHYHQTFGYSLDMIDVVGPPPLDPVIKLLSQPPSQPEISAFLQQHKIPADRSICVYLESATVESKIKGWNRDSRLAHFDEIIQLVAEAGRQLIVKLHPATEMQSLDKYRDDKRVIFVRKIDLPLLLYMAESIIGFVSSTLDAAIVLGKPVFTPTWGIAAHLPNDYLRNGVAVATCSPQALVDAIRDPEKTLAAVRESRTRYVERFISFTDGKAIRRIVDAIVAMSNKQAAKS